MDALASAPKSRIINVSSYGHEFATMNFDDLMFEKSFSSMQSYAQSKLANILFSRELAKRLKGEFLVIWIKSPLIKIPNGHLLKFICSLSPPLR